jgi:hypothetical protein
LAAFTYYEKASAFDSRPRGVAKDKFWIDDDFASGVLLVLAAAEDVIENDVADFLAGNVNCGERRGAKFSQLNIIEAG